MNDGRIFIAEITVVVDSAGTEQTFYFSTSPFTTKPTDTPANKAVSAYLKNAGTYKADLFSRGRVTGLVQPNYGVMTLANPLDSTGKGVFDDWNDYGVSNARVVLRMGYETDAYPANWTTVYIARIYKLSVTNDEVNITLRDRSELFNKPVNGNVFLGTGGMEGNGANLGRKKQSVFGDPGFHPAICINIQKQIYYVSNNGCDTWQADAGLLSPYNGSQDYNAAFDVYDNAYKLLRKDNYTSFSELETTVPGSGEVRFWLGGTSSYTSYWYKGPVYFRLGSPPAGEIRVYGVGYPNENDFNNVGGAYGSFFLEILALRTGLTISDIQSVDKWTTTIAGAQLIEEDQSYLQVMSDACLQTNSWFGFNRQDIFVTGYVLDPKSRFAYYGIKIPEFPDGVPGHYDVEDTTSLFTFTDNYIKNLRSDSVNGQENPMWAAVFNAGRTWPVSNIAGGASDVNRDYMTRQPYYDSFKAYSDPTKIKNPNAETIDIVIPTRSMVNDFTRHLYSARFMWLYAGNPKTFTFTTDLLPELLAIELNDVVTLQTARFGLSAGIKLRVIGMTINTQTREIEFILWVNGRGVWTGATSPLDPGTEPWDRDRETRKLVDKIGKVYWPNWTFRTNGSLGVGSGSGGSYLQIPNWTFLTSGTMPRVDPLASSVVALLRCEGLNNVSGGFANESDIKNIQTFNSGILHKTDSFKYGSSSIARDTTNSGSGFDINIDHDDNFSSLESVRKFTIEAWAKVITKTNGYDSLLIRLEYYNGLTFVEHFQINYVRVSGVNHLTFDTSSYGGPDIDAVIDSTIESQFCHICADWDGTTIRLYLNGAVIGTYSYSAHSSANKFKVKIFNNSSGNTNDVRLDSIRVTCNPVDGCRYGGAFTPDEQDWPRIINYNFGYVQEVTNGTITNNKSNYQLVASNIPTGNFGGVRSGIVITGKKYCEFEVLQRDTTTMYLGLGIGKRTSLVFNAETAMFSAGASGCGIGQHGYTDDGSFTTNSSYSFGVGDKIGIAFDANNGKIWYSKNGTWISGDPSAGTGQTSTATVPNQYYFTSSFYACGAQTGTFRVAIYEKASNQTYAAPTGFLPISPEF